MEILFQKKNKELINKKDFDFFIDQDNFLKDLPTKEIVNIFNLISSYWISKACKVRELIISQEMGFIIAWLKKQNIEKLLATNFQTMSPLDSPTFDKLTNSFLYARPQGIAVHWIAGNVPVLGVISLFQSLLTKNKSIIKVPVNFKNVLPALLEDLSNSNYFSRHEKEILDKLLSSVLILYTDKEDLESQKKLSRNADIRVVWGGLEAVNSVIGLEKKINCRDIIFGPKVSLAYVSKNKLQEEKDLTILSKALADDIFAFDQAGCNAPHNLLIEKGSKYNIYEIAKKISEYFKNKSKGSDYHLEPIDKFNILTKKFLYQSNKKSSVISGANDEWGVYIDTSNKTKIEEPLYGRTVFLSEVKNLEDIGRILPANIQSFGLYTEQKEKEKIIQTLSDFGVDRFPDIGKMSLYGHPWDGYMPLQQMVKWISSN